MKSKSWCSPGQLLMLMLAGWINRHQQAVIAWRAQLLLPRSRVKLGRSNNGTLRDPGGLLNSLAYYTRIVFPDGGYERFARLGPI
jgi:hypothetical protein